MAQQVRRNDRGEVARKKAMLQEKIQAIDPAKREELLVQAALRNSATAGDIIQAGIDQRDRNKPKNSTNNNNQDAGARTEQLIREALTDLPSADRDELLLAAGLRDDTTGGDIAQAAIGAQAGGS
ncbi:hypothetical protein F5Y07DRAFT_395648 [Xylaria sp. FL0933]|nr:hypothetical protein F5Y07DRAFT_395648 [Xylaria sp. FL0933]